VGVAIAAAVARYRNSADRADPLAVRYDEEMIRGELAVPRAVHRFGLCATLILLPALAAAEPPSAADRQRAAALAKEGEALGQRNELGEALARFKEAANLDPATPAYRCNVGLAYYGLSDLPRAHLNLSRCRDARGAWPAGVAEVYRFVEGELAKRDYAPVTFAPTPGDARLSLKAFEDEGALKTPVLVYLAAGSYGYALSADGYEATYGEVRVLDRRPQRVEPMLKPVTIARGSIGDAGGDPTTVARRGGGRSSARTLGWVSLGGGVALGLGGTLAFLKAVGHHDALVEMSKAGAAPSLYEPGTSELTADGQAEVDSMKRWQTGAVVMWGVGAAAAGVGVWLLLRDDGGDAGPIVSGGPLDGGGVLTVSWTR
jgi:hypothetical protein